MPLPVSGGAGALRGGTAHLCYLAGVGHLPDRLRGGCGDGAAGRMAGAVLVGIVGVVYFTTAVFVSRYCCCTGDVTCPIGRNVSDRTVAPKNVFRHKSRGRPARVAPVFYLESEAQGGAVTRGLRKGGVHE